MPQLLGGGAERVVSILSEYFISRNHAVKICLFNANTIEYKFPEQVVIDTSMIRKKKGIIKSIYRFFDLRIMVKNNKETIFISFFSMFNLYLLASGIGLKRKIIVSERLDPQKSIPQKKWLFKLRNILYPIASKIVFQTQDALKCFPNIKEERKVVIPNPLKEGLPERYTGERRKEIVTFARLEPQKNYPLLIDAFKLFSNEFPDYTLSIYGKGSIEDQLKEKVKVEDLCDKIFFKGFESHIHEKIVDCSMFVLSSDYEGLSNAMLEAMAIGLPCICTDCPPGGARMFIKEGENGFLVPVRDVESMYMAMKSLAENDILRETISKNAVKIKDELNQYKICQIWEGIINSI
jgi:glycosyltransferase involved in cell wall biosynthesis